MDTPTSRSSESSQSMDTPTSRSSESSQSIRSEIGRLKSLLDRRHRSKAANAKRTRHADDRMSIGSLLNVNTAHLTESDVSEITATSPPSDTTSDDYLPKDLRRLCNYLPRELPSKRPIPLRYLNGLSFSNSVIQALNTQIDAISFEYVLNRQPRGLPAHPDLGYGYDGRRCLVEFYRGLYPFQLDRPGEFLILLRRLQHGTRTTADPFYFQAIFAAAEDEEWFGDREEDLGQYTHNLISFLKQSPPGTDGEILQSFMDAMFRITSIFERKCLNAECQQIVRATKNSWQLRLEAHKIIKDELDGRPCVTTVQELVREHSYPVFNESSPPGCLCKQGWTETWKGIVELPDTLIIWFRRWATVGNIMDPTYQNAYLSYWINIEEELPAFIFKDDETSSYSLRSVIKWDPACEVYTTFTRASSGWFRCSEPVVNTSIGTVRDCRRYGNIHMAFYQWQPRFTG